MDENGCFKNIYGIRHLRVQKFGNRNYDYLLTKIVCANAELKIWSGGGLSSFPPIQNNIGC
jgi:hypothetical protein